MTCEQFYKYPPQPTTERTTWLKDAPTYTRRTETWAGMDFGVVGVPPAVTEYLVNMEANPPTIVITEPDGRHTVQLLTRNADYTPKEFYGLVYEEDNYDAVDPFSYPDSEAPKHLLRKVATTWEVGDYDSPRIGKVEVTDQLRHISQTIYGYGHPTNQLLQVITQRLGTIGEFSNVMVDLRRTVTDYELDPGYAARHIFNLPKVVTVVGGPAVDLNVSSRTEYAYDHQPLENTPGVVNHSDAANPYAPRYWVPPDKYRQCEYDGESHREICDDITFPAYWTTDYQPSSDYRGNVTEVTRYKDARNRTGKIVESRRYDINGNLITLSHACCEQTRFTYTANTEYAYPEVVTRGAADPTSLIQVTKSFSYDFNTGLQIASTDPNGRVTQATYEAESLRPKQVTLPTLASITYEYDDLAMTTTTTMRDKLRNVAAQTISHLNGLGLLQETDSLAEGNVWNAVTIKYDGLGRIWMQSPPFRLGQGAALSVTSYDLLDRITSIEGADDSRTFLFYDEATWPVYNAEPWAQVETVRVVDPTGRQHWYLKDVLGYLDEVVEPDPHGNGDFSGAGNIATGYGYDYAHGVLTAVAKGIFTKDRRCQYDLFQYDSLGRLTAQSLHEKSATLDDNGVYVGTSGKWSDVFTYDDSSNLISHVDARGVKANYDYQIPDGRGGSENDPLNRLQHITYDLSGFRDTANPILPSPSITYKYMTTGDVSRVHQVVMHRDSDDSWGFHQYDYDSQGRLATKTVSYPGSPPLVLDYKYDDFDRLTQEIYPSENGSASATREEVDYKYGIGGAFTVLSIGGVDYASQPVYNPAGQITSLLVGAPGPQQSTETYTFDPNNGTLTGQRVTVGDSVLLDLTYTPLPGGQLYKLIDNKYAKKGRTYQYDALGRLRQVNSGNDPDSRLWSETYDYDQNGNRTSVTAIGQAADGSSIPLDGLPNLTYDPLTDHITAQGFSYDAAGNQTRAVRGDGSSLRFQYDAAGRLAVVFDGNDKVIEQYAYSADGHRLRTSSGDGSVDPARYYFWDGDKVVAEFTQSSAGSLVWAKSSFYLGQRLLTTFLPSTSGRLVYYNHPDRLGTRLITNDTDSTFKEQLTLPFGTLIPGESSGSINPAFTSYDRSSISGLDYAVNRIYDHQARFTQPDPIGIAAVDLQNPQSLNLYVYAGNDPINGTDASGLGMLSDIKSVWGAFQNAGGVGYVRAMIAGGALNLGVLSYGAGLLASDVVSAGAYVVALTPGAAAIVTMYASVLSQLPGTPESVASVLTNSQGLPQGVTSYAYYSPQDSSEGTAKIWAMDFSDGSSFTIIASPDGTTTWRQTKPDGSQTTTVEDANGNVSTTATDANGKACPRNGCPKTN